MKFSKPKSSDIGTSAVMVGAAGLGAIGTRAIVDAVAKPAIEATPTQSELNKKMIFQGVAAAIGLATFACVSGNDTSATAIKGAALGTAVVNVLDLTAGLIKKDGVTLPNNVAGNALRAGLGLGCPCQSGVAESRYYPTLNQPVYDNLTWDQLRAIRDANIDAQDTPLLNVTNDSAWQSMPV